MYVPLKLATYDDELSMVKAEKTFARRTGKNKEPELGFRQILRISDSAAFCRTSVPGSAARWPEDDEGFRVRSFSTMDTMFRACRFVYSPMG